MPSDGVCGGGDGVGGVRDLNCEHHKRLHMLTKKQITYPGWNRDVPVAYDFEHNILDRSLWKGIISVFSIHIITDGRPIDKDTLGQDSVNSFRL